MKSIIMVTLDCVRPDYLGFAGNKGVDTPHMDAVAREGVFFTQAICQAPNTWVSHASIFSGTNPYQHGIRTPYTKLARQVKTLAELLSSAGFATAGFPGHTLMGPALDFDRGFDYFDIDQEDMKLCSDTAGHYYYREWQEMWPKARNWLESQRGPFFLWVHYMGTHELKPEALKIPAGFLKKYSPKGQFYAGKISWADKECIGTIESFLKEKGLKDEVILVLISDHGDTLVQGRDESSCGRAFHNNRLSDDVMKILWLMRNRQLLPRNLKLEHQVRSIDMVPTLLDLLGLPIADEIEGRSLLDMLAGKEIPGATSFAYMENLPQGWIGLRTPEWKLILTDKVKKEGEQNHVFYKILKKIFPVLKKGKFFQKKDRLRERDPLKRAKKILSRGKVFALYDLNRDPQESLDVSHQHPAVVKRLKLELLETAAGGAQDLERMALQEQEQVEGKLKDLGYLD